MRFNTGRRRGIGLLEVSIISTVIPLLMVPVGIALNRQHENANRLRCARNLSQIGLAMRLYANENRGDYPRAIYDFETTEKPVAYTNPPRPNDLTAAYFLLVTTQEITPDVFICPSVSSAARADHVDNAIRSNFSDPNQLSYSFANPYPSHTAEYAGYKLSTDMPEEFALAADTNPSADELLTATANTVDPEVLKKINSPNHQGEGQNVLFADGHVEFMQTPFSGIKRDNIYTYGNSGQNVGGDGIVGSPVGPEDSVLLPTAKQKAE